MEEQATLLEKIDPFQVIFIIHLIGLLIMPLMDLVVPLHHPFQSETLIKIILVAWSGYLVGKYLGKLTRYKEISVINHSQINIKILIFLIILQFLIVMLRYFFKGIPILSSSPGISKGFFLESPTYGCTRILYIFLPLSIFVYLAYQFKNRKKLFTFGNCYILGIGLFPLFIGLFKGSVITFILGIVLIYDKFLKRVRLKISLRNILLALLIILIPILQYNYSEGEGDFLRSGAYVFQRLTVYSLEGFNYIVYANLPKTVNDQFRILLGVNSDYPQNPGILLSQEMLDKTDPNFSTVTTLYGFCWRNGGWLLVIIAFTVLGLIVEKLVSKIRNSNNEFFVPLYICIIIVLLKTVLVGEPFNDLRGPALSLLFAVVIFKLTKRKPNQNENPIS